MIIMDINVKKFKSNESEELWDYVKREIDDGVIEYCKKDVEATKYIFNGWDPGIRSHGYPMINIHEHPIGPSVTRYEQEKERNMFERLKYKFMKKEPVEDITEKRIERLFEKTDELYEILEEKENKLYGEIEKLRRVIKYGKDGEVTYNLEFILDNSDKKTEIGSYPNYYCCAYFHCCAYLYIYKNCEEYKINLTELNDKQNCINKASESFSTDKDFAYYKVDCKYEWGVVCHSFVIDYKKGTYLHSKEEIENEVEEDVKEVWDADRQRFDYK